jgi:hypothetical protein
MIIQKTDNQNDIDTLNFFDCNCMIGKRSDRREGEPWSVDELLRDMGYFGISDSLVAYSISKDYDPLTGNKELIELLSHHPSLHPVWTIVPTATPEMPSAQHFISESQRAGVKALTGFPKLHNFSLADWCIGDLLTEIGRAGIPLLLPFAEINWDEIHALCTAHPDVNVIVHTVDYRQLRYLLPLWRIHRNLYIETSWFSIQNILSFLTQHNLLDRLIFGTNYPVYTPGAAITMITYADVSDDIKAKVAGGNLRGLLHHPLREKS